MMSRQIILSCTAVKLVFTLLFSATACNSVQMLPDGAAFPLGYQDKTGEFVRIMTWNVEHFVDQFDDPYVHHKREDFPDISEEKIELFTKALRIADADIIVLQEFESAAFLEQLAAEHFPDMNYEFFADYRSRDWYMNVVMMSRVPLGVMYGYGNIYTPAKYEDEKGKRHKETQRRINTRMWSCEVWPATNRNIVITGLHLKAGQKNRDIAVRAGQIEFLNHRHDRFMREDRNTNLVVLGDLNASPDSPELEKLKNGAQKTKLHNLVADSINTHTADNPSRRFDYILVNENMKRYYKENSAEVPLFFNPEDMRKISDHLPVYADFYIIPK